jgi:hypothetical protein
MERAEIERMFATMNVPGDFEVTQISWRPDYDSFFYQQLSSRALRIYLFRDEYIFELEKAVVVETPQLGNATYLFASLKAWIVSWLFIRRSQKTTFGTIGRILEKNSGSSAGSFMGVIRAAGRGS